MKTTDDYELRPDDLGLRLAAWMASTAPTHEPAGLVVGVVGRTGSVRQRPAILVRTGLGVGALGSWSQQGPVRRLVVVGLVALSLLALVSALLVALGRPLATVAPEVEAATLQTVARWPEALDVDGAVAVGTGVGLLDGGSLLVVGASASVMDITTGQVRPVTAGYQPGSPDHLVRLDDGRMLIAGWPEDPSAYSYVVKIYDPKREAFSFAGDLTDRRNSPGVVKLADGRVLMAGGYLVPAGTPVATAEVFDPTTGAFTPTGSMHEARPNPLLTLLEDGRVLVFNGLDDCDPDCHVTSAEVYDPATGRFEATGEIVGRANVRIGGTDWWRASPVRLADGRVLVFGGQIEPRGCTRTRGIKPIAAELYDPSTGTFTAAPPVPHDVSTATLMPDGRVLVAGQWTAYLPGVMTVPGPAEPRLLDFCQGPRSTLTDPWIGIYDPATGIVHESRNPITDESSLAVESDHAYSSSLPLPDGRVLLLGHQTNTAIEPIVVHEGTEAPDRSAEASELVVDIFEASATP